MLHNRHNPQVPARKTDAFGVIARLIGWAEAMESIGDSGLAGRMRFLNSKQTGRTPSPTWRKLVRSLARKVGRFIASEGGPTAVEYAVMLALIVIVCLAAIKSIGTNASTTFNKVAQSL